MHRYKFAGAGYRRRYRCIEEFRKWSNRQTALLWRLAFSFDNNKTRRFTGKNIFDAATQLKRNWHSAAPEVLATPGYLNSEDSYELQGDVHIIPEVFSPDGDGVDDVATITYSFDDAGSTVNVYLFNTGRKACQSSGKRCYDTQRRCIYLEWWWWKRRKKDVGIYFLVFERKQTDGTNWFTNADAF